MIMLILVAVTLNQLAFVSRFVFLFASSWVYRSIGFSWLAPKQARDRKDCK